MPSREQVAEVVSAHLWHHTKHTHCVCGWRSSLAQLAVGGYTAHVADALMPLFEQARNEALEEAAAKVALRASALNREIEADHHHDVDAAHGVLEGLELAEHDIRALKTGGGGSSG